MKKIGVAIVVILILAAFTRCGQITKLSGKYVNEQDKSEYLKFSGESTVVLHTDGKNYKGTYDIYENALMLTFNTNDKIENEIMEIRDKKVLLTLTDVAFVKRTFWNYYWKIWLLVTCIISAASFLYKRIVKEQKGLKDIIKDIKDENFD